MSKPLQELKSLNHKITYMPWMMLLLLTACMLLGYFGMSSVPTLAPLIKEELTLTPTQVGALMVSFYVGTTITAFAYMFFLDGYKVRTSLSIGLFLIGLFILFASYSKGYWLYFIFLAVAGAGYGIINPAINKGVIAWVPKNVRGTAISIKQVGVMLGGSLSAATLPVIAVTYSIFYALFFTGILIVVMGWIAFFFYKEKDKETNDNFAKKEMKPYGVLEILKNKNLLLVTVTGMILVGAQFSYFMYLALYLTNDFKYSVILAGTLLSTASAGGALGRILWGGVSDFMFKGARKTVLQIICLSSFLVCLILASIPTDTSVIFIGILLFMYGMTIGGWNGVMQAFAIELAEPEHVGVVSSFFLSFIFLATLSFPFFFGLVIETVGSYRISWVLSAITIVLAAVLLLFIKENKQQ
ncbi:MFS transporter [Alkalihalobacillus sp. BA299]|uniref:MFS transporter n=1 Tax=Alkalihalobacillus sp. BA299 TaxID=2815938 RepID=UPI001ADBCA08|nr:MFS transporter [Alkalihalobacillus sp. BA299]